MHNLEKQETHTNFVWNRPLKRPRHVEGKDNETELRER
jgi:hypothetical protein